uniref:VWFD domain-containing protein n=1 Tax=Callorhinchus milii TaxID=7868 RepID=A0A4W3IUG6_CALMI
MEGRGTFNHYSLCVVHGDPHYKTFDKQAHNFMGTCTYTLSKLCDANSTLPYFNVEAANEHRRGNSRVSYVRHVNIDVYNHRITLEKKHVVKVYNKIKSCGVHLVCRAQLDDGSFDGNHRVEVALTSVFKEKVCGMCGNYNGNKRDDFLNPDGIMESNSVNLGNSWQVYNDTWYVLLKSIKCHSVLDPSDYFTSCVYDMCAIDMDTESLCSSLQSYADACQSHGVRVEPWRNETFCRNHYEQCGSACPATCVNPHAPSTCPLPCVEGCVCNSGYLLYNDRCVPNRQCGCWEGGTHHPVGSDKIVCEDSTCAKDSYCGVVNGVPGCYPQTYGICRIHNDPHYNTFDKQTHHFMGTCTYTIAKLCTNSSSLPHFNIEAKNENRGNVKISYVQKVYIDVYGHRVTIVKGQQNRVLVSTSFLFCFLFSGSSAYTVLLPRVVSNSLYFCSKRYL